MNKAKYLLLGLLLSSLVFVAAQNDDPFGGDGSGGENIFDGGGNGGGDPFGGGGDEGGDPFGGGGDEGGDPFGGGGDEGGDPFGGGGDEGGDPFAEPDGGTPDEGVSVETEVKVDADAAVDVDTEATAAVEAEDYQDPVFTYQDIPVTPERKIIDFYYPQLVTYGGTMILPGIETEEQAIEQVDIVEFNFYAGHTFSVSDSFYISIGLHAQVYDLTIDNFNNIDGNDQEETLYGLEIPIGLHILLSEQLMISLEGAPGTYTDLQGSFDNRDLQIYGGMRITYKYSNTLALVGGAYVGPDVTGYQVVPFGGLIWKPDPMISAEIIAPFHAKISLNLHDYPISFLIFYESLYFKHFRVDDNFLGNGGEEDDFQYESQRVGVGARFKFTEGVYLEAILGGTLDGKFDANKDDTLDRSLEGGSFFAKVGFSVDMSFFEN